MISKLNMDIYSINENEMKNCIEIPDRAKPHQSWAKRAELEKAFSKHSVTLSAEIVEVASEAKEVLRLTRTSLREMSLNGSC